MLMAPNGAGAIDVDRRRHATHQPVGVRVLAAVDGMDLDDLLLEIERFQIMGDRHQVGFRCSL